MKNEILITTNTFDIEYRNELTNDIDNILSILDHYENHCYIYKDRFYKYDKYLYPIRIVGKTIGGIYVDSDDKILDLVIDCSINKKDEIKQLLNKYKNKKIIFMED